MYTTVGFGHSKPLPVETAQAQLERCAKIADKTKAVELVIIENPASRILGISPHANSNANAQQRYGYDGNNIDYPLYHFRRHVVDSHATSRRSLNYPDAITGDTLLSLASLLGHDGFKLTSIHVSAKPLVANPKAHGLLETPDISIVGAYDPRDTQGVGAFLDAVELMEGSTPNHFLGNVLNIRLSSGDVAHFQPYALTYHGTSITPDYQ